MPYYEIVYETGNHSVAEYADDDEANAALQAHQDKAKAGEPATPESAPRSDLTDTPAGPTEWPAERIAKVYKYDEHPADYRSDQTIPADEVTQIVTASTDSSGNVNVPEVAAAVRGSASPFVNPETPHDSEYAAPSTDFAWENN